jgi:hypothetical protein
MTPSESFAAIEAQGTAGGPLSTNWSVSSVISNEYPGMAIDLYFNYDDARVPRLDSWKLRKREPTEFCLPIERKGRFEGTAPLDIGDTGNEAKPR